MKKLLLILLIIVTVFMIGCNKEKKDTETTNSKSDFSDVIIVYFSISNNTKTTAEYIAKYLDCGKFEIKPTEPYTEEDINWKNKNSRVYREHENPNLLPQIGKLVPELNAYKTLIICYPIWFGEAPNIMKSYLKQTEDFPKGLKVIPVCTSHTSPMGNSAKNLFKDIKGIDLQEGKRFKLKPTEKEVTEWVKTLNLQ